jgi:ABC-type transport system involved in cytochrome c biogenesis permease subunit
VLGLRLVGQFVGRYVSQVTEAVLSRRFDVRIRCVGLCFFLAGDYIGALSVKYTLGRWSWETSETWILRLVELCGLTAYVPTRGGAANQCLTGCFVSVFALLGVNMFLSGLHSYGEL